MHVYICYMYIVQGCGKIYTKYIFFLQNECGRVSHINLLGEAETIVNEIRINGGPPVPSNISQ